MSTLVVARRMRLVAVGALALIVVGCASGATTAPPAAESPVPATPGSTPPATSPSPSATPRETGPAAVDLGPRLVATVDGVAKPCAMANTETDVWVTGNAPSVLARIDPKTNAIVSQTPMDGSPCGIAVGPDGRLWIALLSIGRVVAVDPETLEIDSTISGLGTQLWDLKIGFGAIWVVDRSKRELLRIEPGDATISARIPIGPSGSGLAIAAGSVWVVDDADSTIRRIDPATNSVAATVGVDRGDAWFANDDDVLFVANHIKGSITRIDSATGSPAQPVSGSKRPLDGTVVGDRVYIPDGGAGTLIELATADGAIALVSRLDNAQNAWVAEFAFGDLWVLDFGGQRIWRISP